MQKSCCFSRFTTIGLLLLLVPASHTRAQDRMAARDARKGEGAHRAGIVEDWSRHHAVYPRSGPIRTMIALQRDPRAILSWQAEARQDWRRWRDPHPVRAPRTGFHRDWSISLGGGSMAASMYPAKYTFDPVGTPNCTNDFVVFTVNVIGSGSQPDIVAFDNLYSGTAGATGICNRSAGADDNGVSATVIWSYNIQSSQGIGLVATSPALSLDGTKVAFVESESTGGILNSSSYFRVLAPHRGDGVATNLQSVTSPVSITTGFATTAPAAGSGAVTSLALVTSDTLSSPFIDYANDVAYVGDDSGRLYRIIDVFCTVDPACTGPTPPAPSLDTSWAASGGTGFVGVCAGEVTGPVMDTTVGNVFVGCANGKLYGFSAATGDAIPGSPLTVGTGFFQGTIVDPPVVDVVNGYVYVVSGQSSGNSSVLVQASTSSFTSPTPVVATLGTGGMFNLHAPAFNDAYFSSPYATVANVQGSVGTGGSVSSTGNTSNWQTYEWGVVGSIPFPTMAALFGVGFDSNHVMTSGAPSNSLQFLDMSATEFSPLTRFLNGGVDELYASGQTATTPNFFLYNLTDFSPGLFPDVEFPLNSTSAVGGSASEGTLSLGGTTGIIVDNDSGDAQASSVYFGVPGANTAVKLTQSTLE